MILYKVNNKGDIFGLSEVSEGYEPQENEYLVDKRYYEPIFDGNSVIESASSEDVNQRGEDDVLVALANKNSIRVIIGDVAVNECNALLDRKQELGEINSQQKNQFFDNIEVVLNAMKLGNSTSARARISGISRGNAPFSDVYDFLDSKITEQEQI